MVDIVMVTYNQGEYIAEAIESVLMQKTNYHYRLIIGDDCSTDNTLAICKDYESKYPEEIFVLSSQNNEGLLRNYIKCFIKCDAKYIAFLEGDDYWIDQYKLQNQIDLLEKKDNIGLIHTGYTVLYNATGEKLELSKKMYKMLRLFQGNIFNKLFECNLICAATLIFRRSIISNIDFEYFINHNCNTIDLIILFQTALNYETAFIEANTSVHRVLNTSVSNSNNFEKIKIFSETKYFIREYFYTKGKTKDFNVSTLKKEMNVFLLLKALKLRNYHYVLRNIKDISVIGLIECYKEWKAHN